MARHRRPTTTRRKLAAALVGVSAFGMVGASAASLGGISSKALGSDTGVVVSCDTDGVIVAFANAYQPATGTYNATSVTISGINPACAGARLDLTLKNSSNGSVGTATIASLTAATSQSVTFSGSGVPAAPIVGVAVVISG